VVCGEILFRIGGKEKRTEAFLVLLLGNRIAWRMAPTPTM
jgi:hypothetical protein